jgi:hypothetical protein
MGVFTLTKVMLPGTHQEHHYQDQVQHSKKINIVVQNKRRNYNRGDLRLATETIATSDVDRQTILPTTTSYFIV